MKYLALGDSISIDDYTEVAGGGAASQFARLVGADEVQDRTRDGLTTDGVLASLRSVSSRPDVVTLTAGGNDFLQGVFEGRLAPGTSRERWVEAVSTRPCRNLEEIAVRLAGFGCPVILNTVYDPTDGDDSLSLQMGLPPESRAAYDAINEHIRQLAAQHGFLLADLEAFCHGHGVQADDTWFTLQIEPNLAGATAIAWHWHELYHQGS